jgi:hypothetical protein
MFLLNPSSNPSSAVYGFPPESPLRAPFKADKICVRNRLDQTACGIAEICDTKATRAFRGNSGVVERQDAHKISGLPQSSAPIVT